MIDLILAVLALFGFGGAVWGGLRIFSRLRAAPAALPPPPMPNPVIIARAARREIEARQRAEREAVGPPTIRGASESEARRAAFERSLGGSE